MPGVRLLLLALSLVVVTTQLDDARATVPGTNGKIAFARFEAGDQEIYTMNSDGSGKVNVTNHTSFDQQPDWSPDGTRIAFVSDRSGNNEVYVMNANGSGVTNLSQNAANDSAPAWSPDGTKIAFTTNRDGNDEIYVMSNTGAGQTNLTNFAPHDSDAEWSPDGTMIAYSFGNLNDRDVAVMDSAGVDSNLLTNSPGVDDHSPSWSPSGEQIAFTTDRDGDDEIYVMLADGSDETNLTNDGAEDESPSWSPDCTRIAFRSDFTGFEEIWTMTVDGSDFDNLSNHPPAAPIDSSPDWQTVPGAANLDCDSDGFLDETEVICGSDPLDAASVPERTDTPGDDDGDGPINEALPGGHGTRDCDADNAIGNAEATAALLTNPQDPDTDDDGDLDGSDNCPQWANATQALPNWTVPANDADCDGWNAAREQHVVTDPIKHCNDNTGANDEPDAWPTDFNDTQTTNLSDVVLIGPSYNKLEGQGGYNKRFDLNITNSVNLSDLVLMGPFHNKTCTP
jgi:Tol biopolymer transport system component